MNAWLHELDLHFGKKLTEFINNKNKENGNKEK